MKHRPLAFALAFVASGTVCLNAPAQQPQPRSRSTRTVPPAPLTTASTDIKSVTGHPLVRRYQGNITLERAVEIALRQNPQVLAAIQDIERTRGLIIEVRAAALPQITVNGSYDQQSRRLLRGGGGFGANGGGGANQLNVSQLGTAQGLVNPGQSVDVGAGTDTGGSVAGGSTGSAGGNSAQNVRTQARRAVNSPVNLNTATGRRAVAEPINTGTAAGAADLTEVFEQLADALGSGNNQSQSIQNKFWSISIQARQAIYTGGQVTAALKIARFTQESAYYQLRDVVDRTVAQVREQFYLVLLNRALITVSEEAVNLATQQLQDQRNRFEAGTVPRFNVLRAEVELANEQPNLIRARNDYLLAQIQLARLLGIDPGPAGNPEFYAVGELVVSQRRLSLPDALVLARARRPFLKVQRQAILIDSEQIKVELAGYKPRLDASAGWTFRNRTASDELSDVVNGWFFGVSGSWAIFDGFETYGRVKQARARLEQSKINYDDAVRQVDLEVQTAYANLQQSRQTVESQAKNVESALEAVRLAQERFSAGAGTQLEILDARVALTRARTTELQARSDFNRNLAELDRATAANTKYDDTFKDPMEKLERGIYARLAETGLPAPSVPTTEPPAEFRGRTR